MKDLLDLLAGSLGFLLAAGRFRIVDSFSDQNQGYARIGLESEAMLLEVVRERDDMSLRITARSDNGDDWFWLGILRRVIDGDRPGSDRLDSSGVEFLRLNIERLELVYSDPALREVFLKDLATAREERSRELFG